MRYAGVGVEFAAGFGGFVAVGWWVGHHWDCNPWATLVGAALGFVGSMFNLIREGLKMAREASLSDRAKGSKVDDTRG